MGSVYRPTYLAADGKRKKCKAYRIAWVDENGNRQTEKAYPDKKASAEKLRKIEDRVARLREGLPVEGASQLLKPILEASAEHTAELLRVGCKEATAKSHRVWIRNIMAATGWKTLADIRADGFRRYLAAEGERGQSTNTLNVARSRLLAFLEFCVDSGWMPSNPISRVKAAEGGKRPRRRRAFTLDEFIALTSCEVIPRGRRTMYQLAGFSGLRKNEIRQLQKQDCVFDPVPLWKLRPEIAKSGRADVVEMTDDAAELLLPIWEKAEGPTSYLFGLFPAGSTFVKDLKRAGIIKRDERGRQVDPHALRYFFCSQMGRTLPIQKVRDLMRHASIITTCNLYMDLGLDDAALERHRLPRILPRSSEHKSG